MLPKVTINLLGWNSKKYLKNALASALSQDYPNFEVVFIDNGSSDGSVDFVRKSFPRIEIINNQKNLGYAEGHNIGIQAASGEYIICMNPDIILEADFVSRAIKIMQKDDRIGVLGGKLYRMNAAGAKTKIIDSTGLKIFKSRRVIDRGNGEIDQNQYNHLEQVFGISGALPVFRKKALEDIQINGEYFDRDFENYKEDIDLCWRLNLYGWKCVYSPSAVAYHERAAGSGEKMSLKNMLALKKGHSFRAKYFSFKNQSLMLAKNDFWWYYLLDFPFIFFYELKRWGYALIREPKLFSALLMFFKQLPRAFQKRKIIMGNKRVSGQGIRKFFS